MMTKRVDFHEYTKYQVELDETSILMSINGTIGNLGLFGGENVVLGKSAAYINLKNGISRDFIYQSLQMNYIIDQFTDGITGSTIGNLGLSTIRRTLVAMPPTFTEQRAIAEALSDADAWIEGLEQLIAKKRQIKHGAMQALLTGKTRLPGFSGEWEVKRLGEVAYIKTGKRNNQDKSESGAYPFFVRSENIQRIDNYSYDCEAILVPGEGNIGSIFHYIVGKFDVHQRVYAITDFDDGVSGRFAYLWMRLNFGAYALQNTVKATVDSLRLPTFQNFELMLPPTLDEQTAIAEILTDMDAEIGALEAKSAKARAIKQGMMQDLLTGKVRLV